MASTKSEKQTIQASDVGSVPEDFNLPDFSTWVEEQVGFAPYWNPEPNKWFYARVVARDERDPEFVRYLMQSGMPIQCARGPNDAAEEVLVKQGEHFSISVYYSLRDVFDFYLESGIKPYMRVTAIKEVKTKTVGQTCWTWKVQVSPADKAKLESKREHVRQLKEAPSADGAGAPF